MKLCYSYIRSIFVNFIYYSNFSSELCFKTNNRRAVGNCKIHNIIRYQNSFWPRM